MNGNNGDLLLLFQLFVEVFRAEDDVIPLMVISKYIVSRVDQEGMGWDGMGI